MRFSAAGTPPCLFVDGRVFQVPGDEGADDHASGIPGLSLVFVGLGFGVEVEGLGTAIAHCYTRTQLRS